MPGPPPKPPQRRQRSNTPSLNLVITPDAKVAATAPSPAKEWLVVTRAAWQAVWADDVLTAIYNPATDLTSIYRLFEMRDDRERFRRAVRLEPLVVGSQDQPVVNPLARLIPALTHDILALEDRFGLNPQARVRLGVTVGKAARSLDDLVGAVFDDDPAGEEEDPRAVDARPRST